MLELISYIFQFVVSVYHWAERKVAEAQADAAKREEDLKDV